MKIEWLLDILPASSKWPIATHPSRWPVEGLPCLAVQLLFYLSITLIGGCKPNGRLFISPDNKFSLLLPSEWEQYDDGDSSTFAFFDARTWTGNFRLTPLYRAKVPDQIRNRPLELVEEEIAVNPGARRISIGNYDCVHYKRNISQDNEQLVIYYWVAGLDDRLFICSFTIDKGQENTKQNRSALKTVQNIIASIKMR